MSRTTVHACALSIPIASEALSKHAVMYAPAGVTVLYAASEAVRVRGAQIPLFTWFTLKTSSEDEKAHFIVSPISLAAGVILSLALFPARIAYASIGVVAVGDPVASDVGERFGSVRVWQKTLAGSVAGFPAAFAVSPSWVDSTLSLVGSLRGMLLELLFRFDDNLIMPIGAGSTIFVASVL